MIRRGVPPWDGEDRGSSVDALVADADHRAVERQDVVVVVALRGAGVDEGRLPRGEVEATEPAALLPVAARVVDEGAAVARPVGRLEGLGRAVEELAMPAGHVEDLEVAPDVVPIGNEPLPGGPDDAHVAEDRPLEHLRVVRAEEEPHEHVVAQTEVGELHGGEGIAEAGGGEGIGVALPLELDDVRALRLRADLLRDRARGASVLERGQPVAVHGGVGVGRVGLQAAADHPAQLPVRVHALADELHARLEDEVALHPLPDEMELVALRPDVHPGRAERVLLRDRVVCGRARDPGRADVAVSVELTEPALGGGRGRRGGRDQRADEHGEGEHVSPCRRRASSSP